MQNINLSINSQERVTIVGNNCSGKTTLVKGILGGTNVVKSGDWYIPDPHRSGNS
ncbi:MAG: ATP-binding cassette domain-containing protein [Holosporaceae bacterium]|nr:ATP-binding cassette domain-containing protein [Holosporaceae bacterium]